MFEVGERVRAGLYLGTSRGYFEISASYFTDAESYRAVREFICRNTLGTTEATVLNPILSEQLPKPLLHWIEPEDWPRYRTQLVRGNALGRRVVTAFWFFVRWFAIFVLPWLALRRFQVPTASTVPFISAVAIVVSFFTLLHWLNRIMPVHCTEISVRENGISQNFGKQVWDRSFQNISGWRIIEKEFQGRQFGLLLLQERGRVSAIAIPDGTIGEVLCGILRGKGISEALELAEPWAFMSFPA